jgi:hypothetical protein
MTIPEGLSGLLAAIVAADHFIAKSETILQNSVGPFLWAILTRKPIRKRGNNMLGILEFVTKLRSDLEAAMPIIDECAVGVEKLAKLAQAVGPFTGAYAPAVEAGAATAEALAAGIDRAYQQHQTAGGTPESTVAALASVAQTVAASGAVDQPTAAKINAITAAVDPTILAQLNQGG